MSSSSSSRETMRKNKLSAGSRDMGEREVRRFYCPASTAFRTMITSSGGGSSSQLSLVRSGPTQNLEYLQYFIYHSCWLGKLPHHPVPSTPPVQQSPSRHGEVCVETGTETRRHFSSKKNKKVESSLYIQEYPHSSMTFVLHATTRLANERSAALTSAFTHR